MRNTNIAIGVGICLALAAAELLGHLFPAAFRFRPRRYAYSASPRLGYACPGRPEPPNPYAVVVGDSFSAGTPALVLGKMFPARAAAMLGKSFSNRGCPGYGTLQEEIVARRLLRSEHPKWLIVEIFPGNDWLNNYDFSRWKLADHNVPYELYEKIVNDGISPRGLMFRPDTWLVGRSFVYSAAYEALVRWFKEGEPPGAWFRDNRRAAAIGREQAFASLARLKKICRNKNIRLLVVLVRIRPALSEKDNPALLPVLHFLRSRGISFVDPFSALSSAQKKGKELYLPDGHWNAAAQAIVGRLLARRMRVLGL